MTLVYWLSGEVPVDICVLIFNKAYELTLVWWFSSDVWYDTDVLISWEVWDYISWPIFKRTLIWHPCTCCHEMYRDNICLLFVSINSLLDFGVVILTHWPLGDLDAIFNLVLLVGIFPSFKDNALRWVPRDLTNDESTVVQVMSWCRQATSHYLSQC